MAIEFGKGIRGFLGRIPTINYQYTPIPFREMLLAGQLADRAQQRNFQTRENLNKFYNKPLLPKAQQVYDQKAADINTRIDDYMQSGGNLSGMGSMLQGMVFDAGNDRDYITEATNPGVRNKYITTLKQKVEPDLIPYYLGLSDEENLNSPLGSVYNPVMNYSTLKEKDFTSDLYSVASKLKAEEFKQRVEDDGLQSIVTTNTGVSEQQLKNAMIGHYNANMYLQDYANVKSNVLGTDAEAFVTSKIDEIARNLSRAAKIEEGKRTEIPGQGASADNPFTFTGATFNVDSKAYFGDDKAQNILKNFSMTSQDMDLSDKIATGSILRLAMDNAGLTEQDLIRIQSGETQTYSVQGKYGPIEAAGVAKESKDARFKKALDEVFKNSTVTPEYAMYNSGSTNRKQKAAIEALNAAVDYTEILTLDQIKDGNRWEPVTDQTDYDVSKMKIEGISTRPYYNAATKQHFVKVQGKLGEGKDSKVVEGSIPLQSLLKYNQGLGAIYGSQTMIDASKLMIKGQSISGKTFKEATDIIRSNPELFMKSEEDIETLLNSRAWQDTKNMYGIVAKEDGSFSLVLIDPAGQPIPNQPGDVTLNSKSLTELSMYIDAILNTAKKLENVQNK